MSDQSGIYGIQNNNNGKLYIGSSVQLSKRRKRHFNALRKNKHHNQHLQRAFDKDGEKSFSWIVLENVSDVIVLRTKEGSWIKKLDTANPNNGYNFNDEPNAMLGRKHTNETKKKMSKAKQGKYNGEDNPNFGKKQPLSVKLKMALNNSRTKLKSNDVRTIVKMLKREMSHQEIANKFNISRTVITRISNGTRWANITGGPVFPITYNNGVRVFSGSHKKRIGQKRKGQKHSEETKIKISKVMRGKQ
jgi:group I intron endonuclease